MYIMFSVFCDMDLLKGVVSAAVRMSLKLHQVIQLCYKVYINPSFINHYMVLNNGYMLHKGSLHVPR